MSGQEAVAEIVRAHEERDDYFAVILDWKMPDMDGLDTARGNPPQGRAGSPHHHAVGL